MTAVGGDLGPGSLVGPYLLLDRLGEGGMAEVFLARHERLHRMTAIKILLPEVSGRAELVERLLLEARAMAALRHREIVEIFDCDVLPSGRPYIAMEYLHGETTESWLGRVGKLTAHPRLAAAMAGEIARALAVAHEHGIVHRDLKPANLFLCPSRTDPEKFRMKLLDFGIAKLLDNNTPLKTRTGMLLGTPMYMAPEQCRNLRQIDHRADIYALGCVLFEFLCGHPPFVAEALGDVTIAHVSTPAPDVRTLEPTTPTDLAHLVASMLAKSVDARPQSMNDVLASLERIVDTKRDAFASLLVCPSGLEVHGPPSGLPEASPLSPRPPLRAQVAGNHASTERANRGPARWLVGVAVGLLAGAAAVATVVALRGPSASGEAHVSQRAAEAAPAAPPAPSPMKEPASAAPPPPPSPMKRPASAAQEADASLPAIRRSPTVRPVKRARSQDPYQLVAD